LDHTGSREGCFHKCRDGAKGWIKGKFGNKTLYRWSIASWLDQQDVKARLLLHPSSCLHLFFDFFCSPISLSNFKEKTLFSAVHRKQKEDLIARLCKSTNQEIVIEFYNIKYLFHSYITSYNSYKWIRRYAFQWLEIISKRQRKSQRNEITFSALWLNTNCVLRRRYY